MEDTSEVSEEALRSLDSEAVEWPIVCRLALSDVENMKKGEVSWKP